MVMCHHGARSMQVAMYLIQNGFARVFNLSGGIDAWSRDVDPAVLRQVVGGPIERGEQIDPIAVEPGRIQARAIDRRRLRIVELSRLEHKARSRCRREHPRPDRQDLRVQLRRIVEAAKGHVAVASHWRLGSRLRRRKDRLVGQE